LRWLCNPDITTERLAAQLAVALEADHDTLVK
jgi:hypothetical protein